MSGCGRGPKDFTTSRAWWLKSRTVGVSVRSSTLQLRPGKVGFQRQQGRTLSCSLFVQNCTSVRGRIVPKRHAATRACQRRN
jgi:hypothetical protein